MRSSSPTVCRVWTALLLAAAAAGLLAATPASAITGRQVNCLSLYSSFPVYRASERCFYANTCYTTDLCCPSASASNSECLDVTTYACNFTAACDTLRGDYGGSSDSGSDDALVLRAVDGGSSVKCCAANPTTTPAPNVPVFDMVPEDGPAMAVALAQVALGEVGSSSAGSSASDPSSSVPSSSSSLSSSSSSSSVAAAAPVPVDAGCAIPAACSPNNLFGRIILALCPEIPPVYSETFLNMNVASMCCWIDNTTGSVPTGTKDYGCGAELLDLPLTGAFHCNFQLRSNVVCCNGNVTKPSSSSESSSSLAVAARSSHAATDEVDAQMNSRLGLIYSYTDDVCTDRTIIPGDSAAQLHSCAMLSLVSAAACLVTALLW